jgi:hypothetical protein
MALAFCAAFSFATLRAQAPAWQPAPGHTQIPIWPGAAPDARPVAEPELAATAENLVAGKRWTYISNVSQPTMTVYSQRVKTQVWLSSYFPAEATRFSPSTWKARRYATG